MNYTTHYLLCNILGKPVHDSYATVELGRSGSCNAQRLYQVYADTKLVYAIDKIYMKFTIYIDFAVNSTHQ